MRIIRVVDAEASAVLYQYAPDKVKKKTIMNTPHFTEKKRGEKSTKNKENSDKTANKKAKLTLCPSFPLLR